MTTHSHAPNTAINNGFDLVVLAGGAATRMGDITAKTPKSMLCVQDKPCIAHIVESLVNACPPVRHIYIIMRAGDESAFAPARTYLPRPVTFVPEHTPRGTGGALLDIAHHPDISPLFLAVNGDVLFTPTPYELLECAAQRGSAMQYIGVADTANLGHVTVMNRRITSMMTGTGGAGDVNAGLYAFDKRILRAFAQTNTALSFEHDVVPVLIQKANLGAIKTEGHFIDIGTPAAYVAAQSVNHKILASGRV